VRRNNPLRVEGESGLTVVVSAGLFSQPMLVTTIAQAPDTTGPGRETLLETQISQAEEALSKNDSVLGSSRSLQLMPRSAPMRGERRMG